MPFQKGNKLSPGGKKGNKGGRPTREQAAIKQKNLEIKKAAVEVAKDFIDAHVQAFLDTYLAIGTGQVVERLDKEGKKVTLVMVDPATVRHAIDKFVPPIEKHEHSGEVGVRPWVMDAYEPKKKK